MRWMCVVLVGCAGGTSYQSRVADITTGEPIETPSRAASEDEAEPEAEHDDRAILRPRYVRDLDDSIQLHGTCALREGGEVRCWGEPEMPEVDGASAIAVGGYYGNTVCTIRRGRVHCWYPAADGRTPYRARGVHGATKVTAGRELICALVEGGEVWCWGNTRPQSIGVSDAVDVACSYAECCVAHEDGGVSCWSEEWSVEGCSDCGHTASPRERVAGLESIVSLSSDLRRFCARQREGHSWCWMSAAGGHSGLQPRGELVEMEGSDTADSLRPIGQVDVQGTVRLHEGDTGAWSLALGVSDVVELSDAECGRLRDGRVACWGDEANYAEGVLVDLTDTESESRSVSESQTSESQTSESQTSGSQSESHAP